MENKYVYNIESEKTILGSMIASKKICNNALDVLTRDDFYDESNALVFTSIKNLFDHDKIIDNASITNELQTNMKVLDQIGGVDYLAELQDYYIGDKNAEYHIGIVHDLSLIRHLFDTADSLKKEFTTRSITDISDFILKYDTSITNLTKQRSSGGFQTTKEVLDKIAKNLQKKRNSPIKKDITGIDTGYRYLNFLTKGWQPGSLNILAARPSIGKTTFAINLAYNAATQGKVSVAFFSLEMSSTSVIEKMLSSTTMINSSKIQTGDISNSDWMAIEEAQNRLNNINFYIDDTSGIKIGEIKTRLIKLKQNDPNLGLVVIDYLGLINSSDPNLIGREKIDEISRSLKGIARDLNLAIICLSQLSRSNEKEKRKPVLSDLRDSGSIEQDADTVMFLYRENYQKTQEVEQKPDDNGITNGNEIIEVDLKKNRLGQIGVVKLNFMMNVGKFVEISGETQ